VLVTKRDRRLKKVGRGLEVDAKKEYQIKKRMAKSNEGENLRKKEGNLWMEKARRKGNCQN